jgi:type I restriction enzyme, S subunit
MMNKVLTTKNTKGTKNKAYPKYKPASVEWLGAVPEHWEVKKLKWAYQSIGSGDGISPDDIEPIGTYPVYGGNGIMGYTESYNSKNEDIIIGRVGAKCGNVYLEDGQKWISDNALKLTIDKVVLKYLALVLDARNLNQLANQNAQPLITGSMVGNQFIPLPEQQTIAAFLDRETDKIDKLFAKVTIIIARLKEYRTALISSAVTGKIDVSTGLNTRVREAL